MANRFSLTVGKDGMLNYRYSAGPDMAFHFHLLCEVGEPYQQQFRDEIERRGLVIETRELDEKPWIADFIRSQSA